MESTGVPGEIPQLISEKGDERFSLTLRTDPTYAKGKGLMKTYFLNSNLVDPKYTTFDVV